MKIIIVLMLVLLTACSYPKRDNPEVKQRVRESAPVSYKKEITLGEAFTEILDAGEGRMANIINACTRISGKKLSVGEELSFNTLTGKKTEANGYKNAPILVDGEKSYGIGGGVCQVSTTLYMATKNAGLQITEHHNHSEPVPYAPKNMDATVVYGVKDFKFKNNLQTDIYIYVWLQEGKVLAKIVQIS